ncbi:hypothetical protein RJ640_028442 [Escallonia rubra]|uniref:S5 DRBM domain-containing protein n=1 Tax=Escallonia rubra TaxID=112253 RepID=A0AA88UJ78_9ASTE|nr:hypothetical protein RJ640_028442 [Escallonia rubra]
MAAAIVWSRSRASKWSRLLRLTSSQLSSFSTFPSHPSPSTTFHITTTTNTNHLHFQTPHSHGLTRLRFFSTGAGEGFQDSQEIQAIQEGLAEIYRDRQREIDERKRAGLGTADIEAEEEEDYLGIGPVLEKLEKEKLKDPGSNLNRFEEPTDSDSSDDDEMFAPDAVKKRADVFERKSKKLWTENLDDAFKWMAKIDKFEQKHFQLRPEYRVIGDLMNRLKVATGKDKFLLQQKLNRAMRLVDWKEAYDPNNPANYGLIQHEQVGPSVDLLEEAGDEKEKPMIQGLDEDGEVEFDDMKEKDDMLLEQLNAIDKKLEEKLAALDHTFGKKGKVLEEEIRDLAEERNSLTEKKRRPLYRKGFDVKLINVNRTCKVTKGGQVIKYTAMLACGNYHGVVGFAKAKGPAVPIALQKRGRAHVAICVHYLALLVVLVLSSPVLKIAYGWLVQQAYEKCFQNLHYVERHEEHTIAHAVQTTYKKTKVYLWPAKTQTGMKAGRTVQTILNLAGFKNVKTKVIGSRNPHNTVKAVFKALNAIETPKDVQEKFGRTVVESYLL